MDLDAQEMEKKAGGFCCQLTCCHVKFFTYNRRFLI